MIQRYEVSGKEDGIPVRVLFVHLKHALRYAGKLSESEVYDKEEQKYISGTSKFAQRMLKQCQ